MRKTIFITSFNREKIFYKTLIKLKSCRGYDQFHKVIIYQDINKSVYKKIKKIDNKICIISTSYKNNISALHKCNLNTFKGFTKSFEKYKSDYVIFLEDDVLPSYDFLEFHNYIISKYRYDKKFFAANSFSRESGKNLDFSYSKFIYGIGKGWSLSKEKWPVLKKMFEELFYSQKNIFYDCYFETDIIRKYYVIMPFRSRCYEQPSNGLNSRIAQKKSSHWKNWKKSFLNKKKYRIKKYTYKPNQKYTWRKDCQKYTRLNVLIINLRYMMIKERLKEIIKLMIGVKKFFSIKKILIRQI
jgi:hypothetical protein